MNTAVTRNRAVAGKPNDAAVNFDRFIVCGQFVMFDTFSGTVDMAAKIEYSNKVNEFHEGLPQKKNLNLAYETTGHSRSYILAEIDFMTLYRQSIVTFNLSCPVLETLQLLCSEHPLFHTPLIFHLKFVDVPFD